ncbi:MAG: nucleoside-diphosphate sugar epimerase/dehydratase [Hydrogenophaga sp.]|nr:nucleoside-diphosphate sugar epimerase/dehydratase [Hydrogenophaga sp.]
MGLYRAIFRYAGWNAMMAVVQAVAAYGVLFAAVFTLYGVQSVPRTVGILQPLLLFVAIGGVRAVGRFWLGGVYRRLLQRRHWPGVLIYGAGHTGRQLARALGDSHEQRLLGFLDDDDRLQGQSLDGRPVFAPRELPQLIERLNATDVLLAMPSASRSARNAILRHLQDLPLHVRTLPTMAELSSGKVTLNDARELDVEDLLARNAVAPNDLLLNKHTRGKVVMVTGAGGSIGSELCRQILACHPECLLLLEQSEFALYEVHQKLQQQCLQMEADTRVIPLLGSVCDKTRLLRIMCTWQPHIVYHAAAYKHVPMVEHNPTEGVRNNVLGTWMCAEAAQQAQVPHFVLVSTDKAVRPTNTMGASKRLAEMVLQALADQGGPTRFSMVRFGNVLGSSGSVVPLFRKQIEAGGPVTLTHPEITRYFMTIPEAAQLVIQAGAMAHGGDVFVLDMGEPVRIADLARRMITLSGLRVKDENHPQGDIAIAVTGLRPGEKLYEELLIGDNPQPTEHKRILRAHENHLSWVQLEPRLHALLTCLDADDVLSLRQCLLELVEGFTPTDEVVDWRLLTQQSIAAKGPQNVSSLQTAHSPGAAYTQVLH